MRLFVVFLFFAGHLLSAKLANQVTVLLQFEGQPSQISVSALDTELKNIFAFSNVPFRLTIQTAPVVGSLTGNLVIFKMKGSCTMDSIPVGGVSDERGPLAMTHIVDGELLPFADVECDRVRQSVQRIFGRGSPRSHQTEYGAALARVMAHELYHILARSANHQSSGLTKKGLSSRDLTRGRMLLSDAARDTMSSF